MGFNAIIDGSDNWTVGNKHIVLGNGVKMFGPEASPIFYKTAPVPEYNPPKDVNSFVSFFDSFDPFAYPSGGTGDNTVPKRLPGTNNLRW